MSEDTTDQIHIDDLQQELTDCYNYISKLEQANTSTLRLIQLNDQKTALMEASPEFAKALENIEQETSA